MPTGVNVDRWKRRSDRQMGWKGKQTPQLSRGSEVAPGVETEFASRSNIIEAEGRFVIRAEVRTIKANGGNGTGVSAGGALVPGISLVGASGPNIAGGKSRSGVVNRPKYSPPVTKQVVHRNPSGFSIEISSGWSVEVLPPAGRSHRTGWAGEKLPFCFSLFPGKR